MVESLETMDDDLQLTTDYAETFTKPVVALEKDDIVVVSNVYNEALRLPYFLTYYRNPGVKKFFIVDNNSTDETAEILKNAPDVIYFQAASK